MRVLGVIILPEWLIIREREEFACRIMTSLTGWRPLVNGQLSTGRWKVPNREKLISCSTVAICSATAKNLSKLPTRLFLHGQPHIGFELRHDKFKVHPILLNFFYIPIPSC